MPRPARLVSLLLVLCGVGLLTDRVRARASSLSAATPESRLNVPSMPAEVARSLSFGFRSVLADAAFIQAIQIHGARKRASLAEGQPEDRAMARLLTYATDLDPKFRGAYRFAGNALLRETTDGYAAGAFATEGLLAKGAQERPDDWRLPFALGFVRSYYLGRIGQAARDFAAAAATPGSPAYLPLLATRMAADEGDLDTAEQLARTMLAETTEENARREWEERLDAIALERILRRADAAAARFKQVHGRPPSSIDELALSPPLPAEPNGGTWLVEPDGTVRSSKVPRLRVRGRHGTQSGLVPQ